MNTKGTGASAGGGRNRGSSQVTLGLSLKMNRNSRPRGGHSRPLGQCKHGPAATTLAPPELHQCGPGTYSPSRLHTRDVLPPYSVTAFTEPALPGSNGYSADAERKPLLALPGPVPGANCRGWGWGNATARHAPPDYPAPGGTRVRSWPIPFRCPPSSPSVPVWDALRTPGFHFLSYNFTNLIQRSFNESKITNVTLRERKKAAELLQDEVSLTEHSKTIKNEL